MEHTAKELTNLKAIQVYTGSNVEANHKELESLKEGITNLKPRNITLEAYSRRKNIKFFGIPESQGESNDITEELVRTMMEEKMKSPKEDIDIFWTGSSGVDVDVVLKLAKLRGLSN